MGSKPLAGILGIVAVFGLAACGTTTYASQPVPVPAQSVLQQCVATHPDGSTEVVPDDYCVDQLMWVYGGVYYPSSWAFGGSTYLSGNRWYVRGSKSHRPVNVLLTARDPRHGGSARAQGAIRSHNEAVKRKVGIFETTRPASSSVMARNSDDRRAKNFFGGAPKKADTQKVGTTPKTPVRTGWRR